jgi:hypothetical protein
MLFSLKYSTTFGEKPEKIIGYYLDDLKNK